MRYATFIFVLIAAFTATSCKKEDDNNVEPTPAEAGQDLKFYTNGTLRDADSITARHSGNEIIIDYFSSSAPPFVFTGSLIIPDTVETGRNYTFGQNSILSFRSQDTPDVSFKSVSGTYSVTGYNISQKRIEIMFYGSLKGYNANQIETGQNLSVSNGHVVSFYSE